MSNLPPEENSDEVWDEFKWEEFMQQQDRKVDKLMELMDKYHQDPNCDDIIAREMGWTELMKDDNSDDVEEWNRLSQLDDDDDMEGEEWKVAAGIMENEDMREEKMYKQLPAFRLAHEFGLRAFRFAEQLPEKSREDSDVVDFVSNAMIPAAKLAGGASFDEDTSMLGGSIAYCKRGLHAANKCIEALQAMKTRKMVDEASYMSLFKEAKEMRDAIAVYVLELRERFRDGR